MRKATLQVLPTGGTARPPVRPPWVQTDSGTALWGLQDDPMGTALEGLLLCEVGLPGTFTLFFQGALPSLGSVLCWDLGPHTVSLTFPHAPLASAVATSASSALALLCWESPQSSSWMSHPLAWTLWPGVCSGTLWHGPESLARPSSSPPTGTARMGAVGRVGQKGLGGQKICQPLVKSL